MKRVRTCPCKRGQVWVVLVCPYPEENSYMKLKLKLQCQKSLVF